MKWPRSAYTAGRRVRNQTATRTPATNIASAIHGSRVMKGTPSAAARVSRLAMSSQQAPAMARKPSAGATSVENQWKPSRADTRK